MHRALAEQGVRTFGVTDPVGQRARPSGRGSCRPGALRASPRRLRAEHPDGRHPRRLPPSPRLRWTGAALLPFARLARMSTPRGAAPDVFWPSSVTRVRSGMPVGSPASSLAASPFAGRTGQRGLRRTSATPWSRLAPVYLNGASGAPRVTASGRSARSRRGEERRGRAGRTRVLVGRAAGRSPSAPATAVVGAGLLLLAYLQARPPRPAER
jgi:hypothetical protein